MPIINYQQRADQAQNAFFKNPSISKANKDLMQRYLEQYQGKPATRLKLIKHIVFVLQRFPDFKKQMNNRDEVNKLFQKLRKELSVGYISTIVNVTKALARWSNDGELPKAFCDVKSPSKKDQRRDLNPQDMWSWDDAKHFIKYTSSPQLHAVITSQLDAGFRPSEFIDLNYGDVTFKGDTVFIQVRDGKTGSRTVLCRRCNPFLAFWHNNHPTKKKDDPLWVMEFAEKSHTDSELNSKQKVSKTAESVKGVVRRYDYWALKKRVEAIAKKAGIVKPADFYNLRHSSCTLDKKENLPLDVAAERHGHTIEYFTEVYGRLDVDAVADRMRRHYSGKSERVCESCDTVNGINDDVCSKCQKPLTVKKALEIAQNTEQQIVERTQEYVLKLFAEYKGKSKKDLKAELARLPQV